MLFRSAGLILAWRKADRNPACAKNPKNPDEKTTPVRTPFPTTTLPDIPYCLSFRILPYHRSRFKVFVSFQQLTPARIDLFDNGWKDRVILPFL